jgi:cysteine desulfurase family protein (TIGR01976 family)
MALDVAALRTHFPSLASGLAHFDGPGGTQTPTAVGAAIAAALTGPLSNRGRRSLSERRADDVVTAFRSAYADLLGVPAAGIVYGRSATQLAYDFAHHLAASWNAGDEVVVSRLDHDSNVSPWVQAAERVGAVVRWIDFDPATGEVDADAAAALISARTRLVAITGASNLIGTVPPLRAIADAAHAVGALVWVDAVHLAAHELVDAPALGADLLVCSPYKFLGPHCGVLAADPLLLATIHPDKLTPSTDAVPERFEYGTLPYEVMAGATAAVDFLAAIDPAARGTRRERLAAGFAALHEHEQRMLDRLLSGLEPLGDAVTVHSRAAHRTPTVLVTFRDASTADAAAFLAERDVVAGSSDFYAYEAALRLGLPQRAGLRMGIAPYTDEADVDRLVEGLRAFLAA